MIMKDRPRKILFLTISGPKGASARYRAYQFVPFLEEAGFAVEAAPPRWRRTGLMRFFARRTEESELLAKAAAAEVVVIQKRLLSRGFIRRLTAAGTPYVFDFDDAIFTSARGPRSLPTQLRVIARLTSTLRGAACAIAGNEYLAEYARAFARRVDVLPTSVDVRRYAVKDSYATPSLDLGWVGSQVTFPYLNLLQPVLSRLSAQLPGLRLTVVADQDYAMPGVSVRNVRWNEDTEAATISSFDIGLMPLDDSPWTRGKCSLKALQYMAAGVPAVCSAVGANLDILENGMDGFLCTTHDEWRDTILRLAADPELRRAVGRRGRAKVERSYSVERTAPKFIELIRSVLAGDGPRSGVPTAAR